MFILSQKARLLLALASFECIMYGAVPAAQVKVPVVNDSVFMVMLHNPRESDQIQEIVIAHPEGGKALVDSLQFLTQSQQLSAQMLGSLIHALFKSRNSCLDGDFKN